MQVEGTAEPVRVLHDPCSGDACVAVDYRAWPPSTTLGIDGGTAHNGRAYQLAARQAVDFQLREGPVSVLVRVDYGEDVAALHRRLQERFGVGLRAETEVVTPGARVGVAGRVRARESFGSPHRSAPYTLAIDAERFWLVPSL